MVSVDKSKCISCGACVAICPDVFEMGSDGKSQVIEGADTSVDCVKRAIASCPVQAISE